MPQPCARRAHRQPPTEQYSTIVGRIYPIQMYIHNCWQNISNTNVQPLNEQHPTYHNCWQNISNTNIYLKTCKCPNLVLEGHTDSPQLNNTPQLLAEYIQYKCTSTIVGRTCTCFDLVLEGHTDTPQLNNTQQFLAVHFPYYIYLCILYSLFSICVFVFSDMTPQNIIVDIPVLSYYPKDSMCLEI